MALIDTGLGWSAEQNYLISAGAALLAQFGGMTDPDHVFTGQPLPKNLSTDADVAAGGLTYAETTDYVWKVASTDNNQIFVFKYSYYFVGVSLGVSGTMRSVRIRKSTSAISRGENRTLGSTYSGTSFKYTTITTGTGNWEIPSAATWYIPVFSSLAEGIGHIGTVDQSFYKLNAGYAVACLVKMRYLDGTMTAPVLISSVPEYAVISKDAATPDPDAGISSFLRDGMAFTMRIDLPIIGANLTTSSLQTVDMTAISNVDPRKIFGTVATAANITITETTNPYGEDPSIEEGGGGETPDDDEVGLEPVVFPSALGTGFCRIYCPTAAQLQDLSDYLWGPLFDLDTVKRLFADPMDSILGLSVVPLSITGNPDIVSIAGVSTGIQLNKLSGQHINVDLGSLNVTERWGAYLDYEPYTKYSIYLPFIGYRTLSADDVMGRQVHLSYDIDLLSGACVAKLVCGSTLLYQWAGSCSMQLPVNASNWNSVISGTVSSIGTMATAIASGGATAPLVAGSIASAATQATMMKPGIERSGGLSGASAFLSGRRAYMIRTYPELVNPGDQPHYIGYPSFITKQLGSLSGYNVVEDIHLEGIPATMAELEEIDTLLHEGVIL